MFRIAFKTNAFLLVAAMVASVTACSGGGGGASAVTPAAPLSAAAAASSTQTASTIHVVQTARMSSSSTSATSVTLKFNAAPAAGDLVVAAVSYLGSTTSITAASGWTLLDTVKTGAIGQATFYHVVASGESGSYAWTSNAGSPLTVAAQDVSGVNAASPIAAHVTQSAGVGYSEATGSLNVAGTLPLAFLTQFAYGDLASGYGSNPSWTGNTTTQPSAGNQFVQEALYGPVTTGSGSVTESWSGGDNSDQVADFVLINPGTSGTTSTQSSSGSVHLVQTARASASSTSATSIAVTLSAAPSAGDVLVASVGFLSATTSVAASNGWSVIDTVKTGAIAQTTLYHVVASGESKAYSFTSSSASPLTVAVEEVGGVDAGNPIAAHVTQSAGVGYSESTGTLNASGTLPLAFLTQFAYGNLASGYGSNPSWTGNTTAQPSAGNQFVQEALNGPVTTGAVSVTESWSGGDNSDQVSELVLVSPGSSGSAGTGGTSTPVPIATAISSPTSAPTSAPVAGANVGYTYAGCPVFPGTPGGHSGGWYNTDVSSAPLESDSSSLIADYTGSGGTKNGFSINSVQYPAQEVINTPSSTTLFPVVRSAWNPPTVTTLPGPAAMYSGSGAPSPGTLMMEAAAGSDGHYNVVNTSNCQYWSAGATSWSGSGFGVWNAGLYDLTKPQPLTTNYGSVADCCGVPMVGFVIKPEELKSGVINHALGWVSPGNEGGLSPIDPNRYVSPAVEAQGGAACTTPAPCMPYGAHIRLKASFNDSNFSPSAKAVAEALKHYGAYLMDTGCCLGISYLAQDWSGINIDSYWSSSDDAYLQTINMSDMDVISPASSNAPN